LALHKFLRALKEDKYVELSLGESGDVTIPLKASDGNNNQRYLDGIFSSF